MGFRTRRSSAVGGRIVDLAGPQLGIRASGQRTISRSSTVACAAPWVAPTQCVAAGPFVAGSARALGVLAESMTTMG
ncbi:MAG: hypothetical protein QOG97_1396 [Acidimicrobiaceae bacterium]|nr:hypothetical protein [Acidimicrobiaceae bacterium]